MKIGEQVVIDGHLVERLTDVAWGVRLPDGEWTTVEEDDRDFGFIGYPPAVELVMLAEQMCDAAAA